MVSFYNRIRLLSVLLIAAALLCSCMAATYEASDAPSEAASDAVVSDFSKEASDDTDKPFNKGQEEILALIERDSELIDLFVNGEVYPELEHGYSYTELESGSEYYNFSSVVSALEEVYGADSDVLEKYFSYPTQSAPVIKNSGGVTSVCLAYVPEFDVKPNTSAAEFMAYTADSARVSVPCSDGNSYVFEAVKTEGAWKLVNSLFFISLALPSDVRWEDSGLENGQNEGSAKKLTGDCLVINIFLDDMVSSWDSAEVESTLGYIKDAATFLENEASRYGADLALHYTDAASSVYIKTSKNISTSGDDLLWIELLFADTTYRTLEGCARAYFTLEDYDNWCVLIHLSKSGRSYAIPCNSNYYDHEIYYSERAVMFYSTDTSRPYYSVAANYAHELLHLFGAHDLYKDFVTGESALLVEHFFPNEIMFNIYDDIGMQAVSPYTAYRVGWSNVIAEPFDGIEMK